MSFQNISHSNFLIENKNRIVFFIVLFVLSSIRMFGQEQTATTQINKEVVLTAATLETKIVTLESQIDFVSWFMGTRQIQINENESADHSNVSPTRKQILTSGVTPNKVLYRTFMKRVNSKDNAIV